MSEILRNGWAKLKEMKRELTEEDNKKKDIENEAKSAGKGVWNPHGPQVCLLLMALDHLITSYSGSYGQLHNANRFPGIRHGMEGKAYRRYMPFIYHLFDELTPSIAIVEQVRDGTTLRVRLILPEGDHQMANIALAGVRSPKAASKQGEASETWGEEVILPSFLILNI